MSVPEGGAVARLGLEPGEYEVRQSLIRNKYAVYGPGGDLVLRGKQKLFKLREQFPFVDADGEPAFRVGAANILDIAGDYEVIDEETDEVVAVLSKNFTFFRHSWTVKDPDGTVLAEVNSRSALLEAVRSLVPYAGLLPHRYAITDPDGIEIGAIEGQFSIRDRYAVRIDEAGDAPTAALVASVIAIDALEGN
ncbi:MAG: LURP-one-related/scramblase family protein [Halobacteriaceae archaeon]